MASLRYSLTMTLVRVALVVAFTSMPHAGFTLLLILPCFAVWAFINVISMTQKPAERRLRAWRMVIWVVVFTGVGLFQRHRIETARTNGEAIVAQIDAFKARTGAWPETLKDIGLPEHHIDRMYYFKDGKPEFYYSDPYAPFSYYRFDFATRAWTYRPG